jgi:tRNA(Ile2) C34 agmatinyltransferase TiaS
MYTITLSSIHGAEDFEYDTKEEALAAVGRLMVKCEEAFAQDEIEREITVRIGGEDAAPICPGCGAPLSDDDPEGYACEVCGKQTQHLNCALKCCDEVKRQAEEE